MNKDRIISKIKKLFAIAEDDNASNEEIQNAMNFAQKLMDSHHLSKEDLSHEPEDDYKKVDNAEFNSYQAYIGTRVFYWEKSLARFVSKFVGVPYYRIDRKEYVKNKFGMVIQPPRLGKSFCFYGVAEDANLAVDMYNELRSLIGSMAVLKYASIYKGDGAKYAEGFCSGLSSQLEAARKIESTQDTHSMILVSRRKDLIKYKENKADLWLAKEKKIRVKTIKASGGSKTGSQSAYAQGKSDGQSTDVSIVRRKKLN